MSDESYQQEWTPFHVPGLFLKGEPNVDGKYDTCPAAKLLFGNGTFPRFRLYMNDGTEQGKTAIPFSMDVEIVNILKSTMDKVMSDPDPSEYVFTIRGNYNYAGEKMEKTGDVGYIGIGKNSKREYYISLTPKGLKTFEFPFRSHYRVELTDKTNERLSIERESRIVAKSWFRSMTFMLTYYYTMYAEEPPHMDD